MMYGSPTHEGPFIPGNTRRYLRIPPSSGIIRTYGDSIRAQARVPNRGTGPHDLSALQLARKGNLRHACHNWLHSKHDRTQKAFLCWTFARWHHVLRHELPETRIQPEDNTRFLVGTGRLHEPFRISKVDTGILGSSDLERDGGMLFEFHLWS